MSYVPDMTERFPDGMEMSDYDIGCDGYEPSPEEIFKDEIIEMLDTKVNEIFTHFQSPEHFNIQSGDITPEEKLQLDDVQENLATIIQSIIYAQTRR